MRTRHLATCSRRASSRPSDTPAAPALLLPVGRGCSLPDVGFHRPVHASCTRHIQARCGTPENLSLSIYQSFPSLFRPLRSLSLALSISLSLSLPLSPSLPFLCAPLSPSLSFSISCCLSLSLPSPIYLSLSPSIPTSHPPTHSSMPLRPSLSHSYTYNILFFLTDWEVIFQIFPLDLAEFFPGKLSIQF